MVTLDVEDLVPVMQFNTPNLKEYETRTSGLDAFGLAFMGSYFPSATAKAPDDEPSMNSIGGGSKLLKVSKSFACR